MPVEEEKQPVEQAPAVVEKKSSRHIWLRVLGVVVPFVVAILVTASFIMGFVWLIVPWWIPLIVFPLIAGYVGGVLWRSWWTLLLVPAVYVLGMVVGEIYISFYRIVVWGGHSPFTNVYDLYISIDVILLVFAVCGAALGTLYGKFRSKQAQPLTSEHAS